jgi:hypothetical protein
VLVVPLHGHILDALERGRLDRLESPDQVDQVSIFLPDTNVILFSFILRNTREFGLEVQSISHLIEKES